MRYQEIPYPHNLILLENPITGDQVRLIFLTGLYEDTWEITEVEQHVTAKGEKRGFRATYIA